MTVPKEEIDVERKKIRKKNKKKKKREDTNSIHCSIIILKLRPTYFYHQTTSQANLIQIWKLTKDILQTNEFYLRFD